MKGVIGMELTKKLINGIEMPRVGLGVYKMTDPQQAVESITTALNAGYRAIDTASFYDNEVQVGEAVRASDVKREDVFVTSKVWNDNQGYDETLRAFEVTLKNLNMDYVDLYLTHWPKPDQFKETYRAIERLYDEKLIRATGVSNHERHHLEALFAQANVQPMVNQIECHPYLSQKSLQAFCADNNIAVTAWSPLGRGRTLEDETIVKLATQYDKTAAQIILRWHLQNDTIVIPKSVTPSRIISNLNVFDFELSPAHMAMMDDLNRDERTGNHPDEFPYDDPRYTR